MSVVEAVSPAGLTERVVETPPVTTRDVLHRAADLLEEFGFCQHAAALTPDGESVGLNHFRDDKRRRVAFCQNGAIGQAVMDLGLTRWPEELAEADFVVNGPFWNDLIGRTKAEVVARLRDAANSA